MASSSEQNAPDPSFTNHGDLSIAEAVPNFDSVGYKSTSIERLIVDQIVLIKGRVQEIQAVNGRKIYLVVRDEEGSTVRCVLSSVTSSGPKVSPEMVKFAASLCLESYVMIEGIVSPSDHSIEGVSRRFHKIEVKKLYCITNIGARVDGHIEEALKAEQKAEQQRKAEQEAKAEQERKRIPIKGDSSSSWKFFDVEAQNVPALGTLGTLRNYCSKLKFGALTAPLKPTNFGTNFQDLTAQSNHGVLSIAEAVSKFSSVGYKSTRIGSLSLEKTMLIKDRVLIKGRVEVIEAVGEEICLVVRDEEGNTVQCMLSSVPLSKFAASLSLKSCVMIEGIFSKLPRKIEVKKLYCIPNIGVGVDGDTEAEIEKALEVERKRISSQAIVLRSGFFGDDGDTEAEIEKALEAERKCISSQAIVMRSGFFSEDEIEDEQLPRVNQMDFRPSTSDATVSPRSQYLCVSVPSVSGVLNFIKLGLAQMFRLALDGLGAIGTKEITKLSLGLFIQLTTCLVAYHIYSNSESSSADQAAQLSKPLSYSVAATDTVGFLASGVGIAIRNCQPRAGSILGGIGAVLAVATFYLIISPFISTI